MLLVAGTQVGLLLPGGARGGKFDITLPTPPLALLRA